MTATALGRVGAVSAMLIALTVVGGSTAAADPPVWAPFPAGFACSGFELQVVLSGPDPVIRETRDRNGNLLRTVAAGRGYDLVFTNSTTQKTFSLEGSSFALRERWAADGSKRVTAQGHNVLILFPNDHPLDGETVPSTKLYDGRVEYTVDPDQVWTMQSFHGTTTDICAELS